MDFAQFNHLVAGWGLGMVTFAIVYVIGEERRVRGVNGCRVTNPKNRGVVPPN